MGNGRGGGCVWWVHRSVGKNTGKRPKFGTWKTPSLKWRTVQHGTTHWWLHDFSGFSYTKCGRVCCFMSFMAQWKPYHRFTSTNCQRSVFRKTYPINSHSSSACCWRVSSCTCSFWITETHHNKWVNNVCLWNCWGFGTSSLENWNIHPPEV